jgi:ABC-type polysaccharide/polyol phosphate export permease
VERNPLTYLIEIGRAPIYYGQLPSARTIAAALAVSLISLLGGWLIFRRLAPSFEGRL